VYNSHRPPGLLWALQGVTWALPSAHWALGSADQTNFRRYDDLLSTDRIDLSNHRVIVLV